MRVGSVTAIKGATTYGLQIGKGWIEIMRPNMFFRRQEAVDAGFGRIAWGNVARFVTFGWEKNDES